MKNPALSFLRPRSNQGFTLLELLVVVMIIGLLASFALPQYKRSVRRAEMMEGLTYGKTIYDSALRYKSVNSDAPTLFSQLDVGFQGINSDSNVIKDGNFAYELNNSGITIMSRLGGYSIRMLYPKITSLAVVAPIVCCPDSGDKNGEWLCKNVSNNTKSTNVSGCYDIS